MTTIDGTMNEVTRRPMNEQRPEAGIRLTEAQLRARRARSIAIAIALGLFVVMIFMVTLVKLGGNVATRPM